MSRHSPHAAGFSLIELLLVVTIVCLLGTAGVVSSHQFFDSGVKRAVIQASGLMEQARQYAIAHNTHTYVGFIEEQTSTEKRLAMAAFASLDGLNLVDFSQADTIAADGNELVPLGPIKTFDHVELVDSSTPGDSAYLYDSGGKIAYRNRLFDHLIHFSPQGGATVSTGKVARVDFMLKPTLGPDAQRAARAFAVQVSGATGQVAVLNP